MFNEIRNELLNILTLTKTNDKEFYTEFLLERFEIDINRQLADLKSKQKELEDNLKTLEYVKKEVKKYFTEQEEKKGE